MGLSLPPDILSAHPQHLCERRAPIGCTSALASGERDPKRLDTAKRPSNPLSNKRGTQNAGNPRKMITPAERRLPVRIRIAVPPNGLGHRHTQITVWLDENCGGDGWAITSSGTRGVPNDAISIYFADATLASAFVARWCVVAKVETAGGVFQVRDDASEARVGAGLHRTP
jgi:hypothetical protein